MPLRFHCLLGFYTLSLHKLTLFYFVVDVGVVCCLGGSVNLVLSVVGGSVFCWFLYSCVWFGDWLFDWLDLTWCVGHVCALWFNFDTFRVGCATSIIGRILRLFGILRLGCVGGCCWFCWLVCLGVFCGVLCWCLSRFWCFGIPLVVWVCAIWVGGFDVVMCITV